MLYIKRLSGLAYVGRLIPLRPLSHFELNFLSFFQGLIALTGHGTVMNEYVFAVLAGDEAISLLIAEPLHFTFSHV